MSEPDDAIAERRREVAEEAAFERETRGSDNLPSIKDVRDGVPLRYTSNLMRQWVRDTMMDPVLKRMYDTAMGVQKFSVPTAVGNVVQVEAPSSVQVKAMQTLISVAVPPQMGLVDGDGNTLPGVLALGPMEMDAARREVHGDRYVAPDAQARLLAGYQENGNDNGSSNGLPPMSERIEAGEFSIVEVDEGIGYDPVTSDDRAPGDYPAEPTLAQKLLANRRAKRARQSPPYPNV